MSGSLTNLLELFTSHTHKPAVLKGSISAVQMAEHIVDIVDPRIRVIGRYAQKLAQPLSRTWDYLNDMANMIPGGVTFSNAGFSSSPRMKLIFDSRGVIQQLLDTVIPLIQENANENLPGRVYMLLCMEKHEHNFLGTNLVGDIIERDVIQTKVTFTNRKILSAGYTEEDARLGFKKCALEALLQKAQALIMQTRNVQKLLIERKKQLHQQLHPAHGSPFLEHSSIFTRNDFMIDMPPELQEIERQLTEVRIKSESPDHHLLQIIEVLNHPEQYLKMETRSIVLNNLGVKSPDDALKKGFNIDYAEVEIEQSLKRIAMIVNCPAEEVFSHKML
ncbi:MAG: hypothetical protein L0Z73_04495 [Gammaproteobacteria bacterium]|nr:hypothetical protein [Gammaproteobacteria bacterium]